MPRLHHRIALVTCLAVGTFGCSWLLGVSEDPVVADPVTDSSTAGRDGSTADARDARIDGASDAPEDASEEAEED